jgi:acetyl esterase/lipase
VLEDRSVLSRPAASPHQVLRYGPDPEHVVDVRFPPSDRGNRPLVMVVHGGFWRPQYDRSHAAPMSEALATAGWTVATIEYRRIPGAPDTTVEDLRLAIEVVPGLIPGHTGKLLLLGHSAGGHLVLWAASCCGSPALHGVIALGPVADLALAHEHGLGEHAVVAFLGTEPKGRPDLDPARLNRPRVPAILLHGELDAIVPLAISQAYQTAHQTSHEQPRLIRLAEAGHFALIDPLTEAWGEVLASLNLLAGGRLT